MNNKYYDISKLDKLNKPLTYIRHPRNKTYKDLCNIAKELKIPNEICQSFIIVYYEQDKKHIIHITKDSIYEVKS